MALSDDIAGDLAIFGEVETVSLSRRSLAGDETALYQDVTALQTQITVEAQPIGDGGVVMVESCNWHLQADTIAVRPRKGDRISAADGTWEVLHAGSATLKTRYPCRCVKV